MKKSTTAYAILISVLIYIFILGIYGEAIANYANAQTSIIRLILYYFTQTEFIVILIGTAYIGSIKNKILQGISAGVLITVAIDMNSTPHCVLSTGFVPDVSILKFCSDSVYIHWLDNIFPHIVSYNLYYWILPMLLIFIAFELLGFTGFIRRFT